MGITRHAHNAKNNIRPLFSDFGKLSKLIFKKSDLKRMDDAIVQSRHCNFKAIQNWLKTFKILLFIGQVK